MSKPERYFFVCTNRRPPGQKPSCGNRGGEAILARLKVGLEKHPECEGRVRISGSTCLGPCESGPTVVAYPANVWYRGVAPEDVDEIVERHLARGEVLERLVDVG